VTDNLYQIDPDKVLARLDRLFRRMCAPE